MIISDSDSILSLSDYSSYFISTTLSVFVLEVSSFYFYISLQDIIDGIPSDLFKPNIYFSCLYCVCTFDEKYCRLYITWWHGGCGSVQRE
jgi:hypothetical protein